jgi:hypothetical protein
VERFVGLDAHASSSMLGVETPSGKRLGSHVVETTARCLIEAVQQIPEPRHVCLEEGTLSEWLYEVLSPPAERVVVTAVRESRGAEGRRAPARSVGRSFTTWVRWEMSSPRAATSVATRGSTWPPRSFFIIRSRSSWDSPPCMPRPDSLER